MITSGLSRVNTGQSCSSSSLRSGLVCPGLLIAAVRSLEGLLNKVVAHQSPETTQDSGCHLVLLANSIFSDFAANLVSLLKSSTHSELNFSKVLNCARKHSLLPWTLTLASIHPQIKISTSHHNTLELFHEGGSLLSRFSKATPSSNDSRNRSGVQVVASSPFGSWYLPR